MPLLKALGEDLFHALLLASGVVSNHWCSLASKHITFISASVFTWHSPRVSVSVSLPFYKDSSHIRLRVYPTVI